MAAAPKRRNPLVEETSSHSSSHRIAQRKRQLKERKNQMKGFFDEEAGLGSDNEDRDDVEKVINKNDAEENEEGLDSDLDGFVEKGDVELIPDAEEDAHAKFIRDLQEDDRQRTREVMQATVFGHNKKRKRGEVVGLDDDLDDFEKRKKQRLQEREQLMNSENEEEMEQHLLVGGTARAREQLKVKEIAEEEELSENEIKEQFENRKFFKYMKEKRHQQQMKSMDQKEQEMEKEIGSLVVDYD